MSSPATPATPFFFIHEKMPLLRGLMLPCGSLWFVATDALAVVGCSNAPGARKRLGPFGWQQIGPNNPLGLHPHSRLINDRALARLVAVDRKSGAAEAAQWVFEHVLPTAYTLRPVGDRAGLRSGEPGEGA